MIPIAPTIAIDKTKHARYSKNPDMTGLIKCKLPGTKTAEAHITSKIVDGDAALNLASFPVIRDEFNPYFIGKIIDELRQCRIKPGLVLLDREFFATDVMQTMNKEGLTFLMPAVKNSRIKTAIKEYIAGKRGSVSQHTIKSQDKQEFTFQLVITLNPNPKNDDPNDIKNYLVFATNHQWCDDAQAVDRIPEQYRERWGIENGYKSINTIRPRTVSTDRSIRLFLFFVGLVVYNLWIIARMGTGDTIRLATLMLNIVGSAWENDAFCQKSFDPG